MTNTSQFRLNPRLYAALWSDLGLGRMPYPVDVPAVATTAEGRAHMWRELGPSGDQLAEGLRVVGNHGTAVDVVADVNGPLRALAASDGRAAVLVVLRNDMVELTRIRTTALTAAALAVLPPGDAGQGNALSVPLDALRAAARVGGRRDERTALVAAGLSGSDAAQVAELAAGRTAGGQLGVTRVRDTGSRVRGKEVITWFDTDKGRYLVISDGAWLSLTPADNSRIKSRLESAISTTN